jgi:putative transposase
MANTYTQIYVHLVFAVKHRQALIQEEWENRLYQYIIGIVEQRKHKILAIGGMPDHIHIFLGWSADESISDLVREIKKASNAWIKEQNLSPFKFEWQNGYGAFSYGRSQIAAVCRYIQNQKEHHRKKSFQAEYVKLLEVFGVEYDEQYLFDWLE